MAAIQFALGDDDGWDFLRYWNEGEFDVLRRNWPEAPEAVYIGADPLHPQTRTPTVTSAAAQPDYVIRETVNQLRDIAIKYHAAGQLREQIAYLIVPLLKGTPTAEGAAGQKGGA